MDKASAPGAGDSRFESWAGHHVFTLARTLYPWFPPPAGSPYSRAAFCGWSAEKKPGQTETQPPSLSLCLSLSFSLSLFFSLFLFAPACLARLREEFRFHAQGVMFLLWSPRRPGVHGQSEAHAHTSLHERQAAGSQGHMHLLAP